MLIIPPEVHAEYPQYLWYPAVLANASSSSEHLAHRLHSHIAQTSDNSTDNLKKYINDELIIPGFGIHDASDEELTALASHPEQAQYLFAQMISIRAQIGWSTHGHSAVDVNIYSSGGPGAEAIRGNVENTDVGKYLRNYLNVDVDAVTEELNKNFKSKRNLGMIGYEIAADTTDKVPALSEDHWVVHEELETARSKP